MSRPELLPGNYFRFLGHYPLKGIQKEVRYRRYAGALDLFSNVGTGRVAVKDIELASSDRMAIKTGTFDFVSRIAIGKTVIQKSKNEWENMREVAISTLEEERFDKDDVVSILESILTDEDQDLISRAEWVMKQIEERKKDEKPEGGDGE